MSTFLPYVFSGLPQGAIFAVLAVALVAIYAATGIINFAQGAIGLYSVYVVAALQYDGTLVLPVGSLDLGKLSPTLMVLIGVLTAVIWSLLAHYLIFRPLRRAPVLAQVVASVGLMLFLQALVQLRFDTNDLRGERILPSDTVEIGGTVVKVSALILAGIAVVVALLLWAYFRFTRWGVATRAGAEDELAARLSGFSPDRLAAVVWTLTGAATGLIVILASDSVGVNVTSYTFYVIPAMAVALVGRLTSIPIAAVAGLLLGVFRSIIKWLALQDWWPEWARTGLDDAVPFLIIVIALFLLGGRIPSRGSLGEVKMPAVKIARIRPIPGLVLIGAVVAAILLTEGTWRYGVVTSVILALIALSLVLLTGYLGQISLAAMAFAGVAGFALSKISLNWNIPFPFGMIVSALIATVFGILVGIPALRIRGAQLAVVTLAAAMAIEKFVFGNPSFSRLQGNTIDDPTLFGMDLGVQDGSNLVTLRFSFMVLIVVAIATIVVLRIMGGSTGRAFLAVRSNERAAASVGIDVAATKLLGFALSAFLAGIGGCLLGYSRGQLSAGSFTVMIGLTLLAMTYVGGITAFSGAVLAGIVGPLGIASVFLDKTLELGEYYELIAAALLMLMAVLNPVGVAGAASEAGDRFREHWARRKAERTGDPDDPGGTPPDAITAPAGTKELATDV